MTLMNFGSSRSQFLRISAAFSDPVRSQCFCTMALSSSISSFDSTRVSSTMSMLQCLSKSPSSS